MNPCKDWCFARFGKEYTQECDKHCDYARLHIELKQLRANLDRVKADRNAAIEQLHGYCPACKNYTPNHNEGHVQSVSMNISSIRTLTQRITGNGVALRRTDHETDNRIQEISWRYASRTK